MCDSTSQSERENKDDLILMICAQNNNKKFSNLAAFSKGGEQNTLSAQQELPLSFVFLIPGSVLSAPKSKKTNAKL